MRLNGRRISGNIIDRRGQRVGGGGGGFNFGGGGGPRFRLGGIGGFIGIAIFVLVSLLWGKDALNIPTGNAGDYAGYSVVDNGGEYRSTAEEDSIATFVGQILAGTEDVWSQKFREMGRTYVPPKLVFFTGAVNSGCGGADASVGPFYCSADQTIYIDLSFFKQMENEMGAGGDFAFAYVIAHEVGHHVQYLLGTLDQAHSRMARMSTAEANKLSVRTELQADYYAGVWARGDNEMYGSMEPGDLEEGLNAATKIGDDYLQKKARGYAQPETFNHGTSAQRVRWLNRGYQSGSVADGDTFSPSYNSL